MIISHWWWLLKEVTMFSLIAEFQIRVRMWLNVKGRRLMIKRLMNASCRRPKNSATCSKKKQSSKLSLNTTLVSNTALSSHGADSHYRNAKICRMEYAQNIINAVYSHCLSLSLGMRQSLVRRSIIYQDLETTRTIHQAPINLLNLWRPTISVVSEDSSFSL